MAASDAQKRAIAKWQKTNTTVVTIRLQHGADKDILQYLEGKGKATEFKKGIRLLMTQQGFPSATPAEVDDGPDFDEDFFGDDS